MTARFERRVRRTRRGDFELRLPPQERELLASLPEQLRELLPTDDPRLRRLFPPAYAGDEELEAEYRRLMRDELVQRRVEALEVMARTVGRKRLTEDELVAWLGVLNDVRLVLGTELDVTEDSYERHVGEDDPRAPAFALYFYLGWLEEHVVDALSSGLESEAG